mgnify:CR=1 FL=1
MPKESVDISRQWADNVCVEIEKDAKTLEFWLNALTDAKTRSDRQNIDRWGRTYAQIEMLIPVLMSHFAVTPLKTPPV